ncbi:MAG: hypothetical protein ABH969_09705 [Pseudomonadota bacterium]
MKKMLLAVFYLFFVFGGIALADEVRFSYNGKTGDKGLDLSLKNLNIQAQGDMKNFISRLSVSYGVPQPKIEDLFVKVKMPPADIYMTVRVAKIVNKPIDVVVDEYKAHKGKGWGVIAKKLGIKPGSKEFHELKNNDSGLMDKGKGKGPKKGKKKGKGRDKGD